MELEKVMMCFIGFAGCFALLVLIWDNRRRNRLEAAGG
jgi:hypothetical protein